MTAKAIKQPKLLRDQNPWKRDMKENWILYVLFLPVLAYFIIFHYIPMSGIFMAFEDYKVTKGLFGSEWVGFEKFIELFEDEQFWLALRNSGAMALFNLTLGFVAPIILALLITSIKPSKGTRTLQTITYLPNFVSAVVVCSLATQFLDLNGGITRILSLLGFEQQNWLANSDVPVFWLINTGIGIWQGAGWGAIVYIAAIYNINGDLHEAAAIDGANRWQRLTHITLPGIHAAHLRYRGLPAHLYLPHGLRRHAGLQSVHGFRSVPVGDCHGAAGVLQLGQQKGHRLRAVLRG